MQEQGGEEQEREGRNGRRRGIRGGEKQEEQRNRRRRNRNRNRREEEEKE